MKLIVKSLHTTNRVHKLDTVKLSNLHYGIKLSK